MLVACDKSAEFDEEILEVENPIEFVIYSANPEKVGVVREYVVKANCMKKISPKKPRFL